ncbi:MAG TPA: ABC transporter permease [Blastocatellia bacterium]|nr:ABC transporter permease [Blastocatellia bacterium]
MQTLQDLRYGVRMLLKRPGFTLVAIATLALGIGANTAIFSVVNAVMLRPLPYPEPERVMQLGLDLSGGTMTASQPKFVFWRDHQQSFEAVAATQGVGSGINLAGGDEPEYVRGLRVSADFFSVIGIGPRVGRGFTPQEDSPTGERVVILSHELWQRRFAADPALVGKAISLNSENYTVVGVMPEGFEYTSPADLFVPLRTNPASRDEGHNYTVLGRLRPGVTLAQANSDMQLVFAGFKAAYPQMLWKRETGISVRPYLESLTVSVRPLLLILLGAVGFVLLIACVNVANLQLVRAAARQREMAIRRAMGAGVGRIVRQLVTEGVLLALAGGAAGLLLAVWGTEMLVALVPERMIPRVAESHPDWRVLVFTLVTSVVTGLIFALAPAIQAARVDVNHSLKEGEGKGTVGVGRGRLRNVLVIIEVALSLVLLAGAALLVRSFANLRQVEPGFDPHGVLTFQIAPNGARYETTAGNADLFRRALERIKSLPGVEAAAVTSNLPLDAWLNLTVEVEGRPESQSSTEYRMVTPEYFRVMKMKLKEGREFTEADKAGAESVVIVNESYARRFLAKDGPLGQHLVVQRSVEGSRPIEVVGVVADAKQFGLNTQAPPTVFVPIDQIPDKLLKVARQFVTMKFVIRTSVDPLSLAAAVKKEMLGLDASLPVTAVRSMDQVVERSLAPNRLNMTLLGVFAAIGLLLAAVGIYGVMSYSVAQRTGEIGIRMALGARGADVMKLVLRHGMKLALVGVVTGLGGAFALTRVMEGMLFGVSATDPLTFTVIALLLVAVALLACWLPARRATKVDPLVALRYE